MSLILNSIACPAYDTATGMTQSERTCAAICATDLVQRAGDLGMRFFRDLDTLTIESKGHQDMVSEADREVELFVRRELAAAYPDDGIVGEEHAPTAGL